MAAPITSDEYAKAYGATGDADVWSSMVIPLFGKNDYVYLASEYTLTAGDTTSFVYNPYKIVFEGIKTFDSGGALIKALQADGVTAAVSATVGNAVDTPTFFDLQDQKGNTLRGIHCSLVIDQTALDTLVGGEVSDWPVPTF